MKITRQQHTKPSVRLLNISAGHAVQFVKPFHQSMRRDDPFLVIADCSYMPVEEYGTRCYVANLRTGKLSLVSSDRAVWFLNADLTIR